MRRGSQLAGRGPERGTIHQGTGGKWREAPGRTSNGDYPGSAFTIQKHPNKGDGYVLLVSPKVKGPKFEATVLNFESRWFELWAEAPASPRVLNAQDIAGFVGIAAR